MSRWPDNTPRSTGNAFDWRGKPSKIFASDEWKRLEHGRRNAPVNPKPITTYLKAKAST